MKNIRVILVIVLTLILVVVLCSALYAAYLPIFKEQLSEHQATQTQAGIYDQATFEADQTRVANETAITLQTTADYAATLTAMPTSTPTPSSTPMPTSPPTSTLAPQANICLAEVIGGNRKMYSVPGGGRRQDAQTVRTGDIIEVLGRFEDRCWYKVKYNDYLGWLRNDFVKFQDSGCTPTTYQISHLLGIMGDADRSILDDTFITNQNHWEFQEDEIIFPEETEFGESYLPIDTRELVIVRSDHQELKNISAFNLVTTFSRANIDVTSYVGFRFRSGGRYYYELRILGNCVVEVYANENMVFRRSVESGENNCSDLIQDYVELSLDENYELILRINDSEPLRATLSDPDGHYASGTIELVVNATKTAFDFLVVTAPR